MRAIAARKEAAYAESPVAATLFASLQSESLQSNVAFEKLAPARANSIRALNILSENRGGDIELLGSYDDEVGIYFLGLLGSSTQTAPGPPAVNVFPATTGTLGRLGVSLGVEIQRDSFALTSRYMGIKVVGFTYSASLTQSPRLGFSLLGKDQSDGAGSTVSVPAFNPMTIGDTTLSFDGGATPALVQSLNVKASWPVDEPHVMQDTKFAVEPIDSDFMTVEGEATIILQNLTEFDKLATQGVIDIEVKTTDGTGIFQLDMLNSRYSAYQWNVAGKERLLANIVWESIFNATAQENLLVTITSADTTNYGTM